MAKQAVENVDKLPKWAQSKIKVLEMRLSEATSTLAELGSKEPTDTRILRPWVKGRGDLNLPNNSVIEFRPKDGKPMEVTLRHDETDGIVITSGSSGGGLRVAPWSSNCVKIYVEDH